MKISISSIASAYEGFSMESTSDDDDDVLIEDTSTLAALDGLVFEEDSCYKYLDYELAVLGIIGGTVRCSFSPSEGLRVIADYWAPEELSPHVLRRLINNTTGQWSDGLGECGFRFVAAGQEIDVFADYASENVSAVQLEDGVAVPPASNVAICAREGDVEGLGVALSGGEDPNSQLQEYPALHLAIGSGRVDTALMLIEHGADIELRDPQDHSMLHHCALANKLSDEDSARIASVLLQRGADPEARTPVGDTARELAVIRGKTQLAGLF